MNEPAPPPDHDDWRVVSGGLLRGLSHDLNGRVMGLQAVALALDDGDLDRATALLREESGRLDTLARRLHALARSYAEPEAVDMAELCREALALARLDRDLEPLELTCETDREGPVAFAPGPVLLRTILAVLTGLARSAHRAGASGVHLHAGVDGPEVLLTATVVAGGAGGAAARDFTDSPAFEVISAAARSFQGRLRAPDSGPPRVELRAPSSRAGA